VPFSLLERFCITYGGNADNKETGVVVAKDWETSRTMFFQGGEYVTPLSSMYSIFTTV